MQQYFDYVNKISYQGKTHTLNYLSEEFVLVTRRRFKVAIMLSGFRSGPEHFLQQTAYDEIVSTKLMITRFKCMHGLSESSLNGG